VFSVPGKQINQTSLACFRDQYACDAGQEKAGVSDMNTHVQGLQGFSMPGPQRMWICPRGVIDLWLSPKLLVLLVLQMPIQTAGHRWWQGSHAGIVWLSLKQICQGSVFNLSFSETVISAVLADFES